MKEDLVGKVGYIEFSGYTFTVCNETIDSLNFEASNINTIFDLY